jgi:chemotaxis protein methyltransferase CheR
MPPCGSDGAMIFEAPEVSDSLFALLRDAIHERTGLFYDASSRDSMIGRLSARVLDLGFDSFLDYYYLLKYDAAANAEWGHLLDALTVRETFFWREIDHIRALVDVVVPQYAARRPGVPLRIWSAACATGEEPLTLAIALQEAGWFERMQIELYASDISPLAVSMARQGLYPERSFRSLPATLRAKYFTAGDGGWRVAADLHRRVHWATANLLALNEVAYLATAPVVFCRNVFIYFSEPAIRKTLRLFFERMIAPGHLFVGVSEPLLRLTTDFELQDVGGAFVYVKREQRAI